MSIAIEDVPCWIVQEGISHAVAYAKDPGTFTACGSLFWGVFPPKSAAKKKKHNGRICRKCRERLKEAHLLSTKEPAHA